MLDTMETDGTPVATALCFIEWSACGEAVGSSWRAAAEEELDALYRKRRSARLEKTSPAVALLYPRCAKGTLALRSALARQGNRLSVFEHTTSRIPSLDSGGGGSLGPLLLPPVRSSHP